MTEVFKKCKLSNFAQLVGDQLGVDVRLKGRKVSIEWGNPSVLSLPSFENARDQDIESLFGFFLHEALHLRFTSPKVLSDMPSFVLKFIHNAIEDEYIERMGERDYPDAREILQKSYETGFEFLMDNNCNLPDRTINYLNDRAAVKKVMDKIGLDVENKELFDQVARRLEIERVSWLWFVEARGYNLPLYDWKDHPWREVFNRHTEFRARSSNAALEQASAIAAELDLCEVFQNDSRPVEDAKRLATTANEKIAIKHEAERGLKEVLDERKSSIKQAQLALIEYQWLQEKKTLREDATRAKDKASAVFQRFNGAYKKAVEASTKTSRNLVKQRKRVRTLEQAVKKAVKAGSPDLEGLEASLEMARFKVDCSEIVLQKREERVEVMGKEKDRLQEESSAARFAHLDTIDAEAKAQTSYDESATMAKNDVESKFLPMVTPMESLVETTTEEANDAEAAAKDLIGYISKRDGEIEAPFGPGMLEVLIGTAFNVYKQESVKNEIGAGAEKIIDLKAQKYCPYTRQFDVEQHVEETPEAVAAYDEALLKNRRLIEQTKEHLRRLYSPTKTRLKSNVDQGRLNRRMAYKVGLAIHAGVDVDLTRIWQKVVTRKDPRVAVQIVLDCSGSMNKRTEGGKKADSYMNIARQAAAALSEVLTSINVPHEVVGHTTKTKDVKRMDVGSVPQEDGSVVVTVDGEDAGVMREKAMTHTGDFSRYVPFRGYTFKTFKDTGAPVNLFSKFEQEDNLDGEAILWGMNRLAHRREKTKVMILISDAAPDATLSNTSELERHLLSVNRQIEEKEKEGIHLIALGLDGKIKNFFKNAEVMKTIDDLPQAMLGSVERILTKIGSLG